MTSERGGPPDGHPIFYSEHSPPLAALASAAHAAAQSSARATTAVDQRPVREGRAGGWVPVRVGGRAVQGLGKHRPGSRHLPSRSLARQMHTAAVVRACRDASHCARLHSIGRLISAQLAWSLSAQILGQVSVLYVVVASCCK